MAMGARVGIWVLDIDTPEDHVDGTANWNALTAEHDPFATREHRSATGGPHLVFNWDAEQPIHCGRGGLPPGMEVKGQGGYVVVPPSRRKGRPYTTYRDIDPLDTPQWLADLVLQGRSRSDGGDGEVRPFDGKPELGEDELAEIMSFVPNDDLHWDDWTSIGLAMFSASGGSKWGFEIFDAWSETSIKYERDTTRERWEEIKGSPPNRTGVGKLRKIARENGWEPGLYAQPTIYPSEGDYISDAKRGEIRKIVREFLDDPKHNPYFEYPFHGRWQERNTEACRVKIHIDSLQRRGKQVPPLEAYVWENYWKQVLEEPYRPPPIVWAIKVVTGGGKTSIIVEEIARWLKERGREVTPIIYQVTTHKLAEEIKKKFIALGIDARVFRGYLAPDPNDAGNIEELKRYPNTPKEELAKLCRMEELMALAMKTKQPAAETCCKQGKLECPFYKGEWICAFRRQMPVGDNFPEVWITASDMLYFNHKVFEDVKRVIVDENFYQKGLRGIVDKDDVDDEDVDADERRLSIPLASLIIEPVDGVMDLTDVGDHTWMRHQLAWALRRQVKPGGLDSQYRG